MKPGKTLPVGIAIASALLGSCGHKPTEAEQKRQEWLTSLNDSIRLFEQRRETVNDLLVQTRNQVNEAAVDFDYVNNPREVEGYYILKDWKGHYPLTSTGLVARITETEGFELIATLSGKHFDQIAVTADGQTLSSARVPHDQALNYRTASFTKACFTGTAADSIGALTALADGRGIKLAFLEGSPVASVSLSDRQGSMVARTYRFSSLQRQLHSLEAELPRLSGKINACRRILEADSTKNKTNE